jgi:tRNA dimethylallyltransferase
VVGIISEMSESLESPLVVIVGPTASGKSTLAVALAERVGGEVVACDSTQLYRGFDIGTAKPTAAERHGISHHLIDVLEPTEDATAGGYRERAIDTLENLKARNKLPIFTVGTGLYLRALLEGFAEVPQRSESLRERLRDSAAEHGPRHLHGVLRRMDPVSAAKIAPGDQQKLIRAIEVCLLTKKTLSEVHRSGRNPLQGWRAVKIGLAPEREALYRRVHGRTESMLQNGWLEEVRTLMASGLPENAKPFDFIGYRELRAVVRKEILLTEARAAIEQATRRYAKRQMTWFRREVGVHWMNGVGEDKILQEELVKWVNAQLGADGREGAGLDV